MSFTDTISTIVGAVVERMGFHYLALREYRVSSQNADGTLELEALDINKPGSSPGLSNVKIMQIGPGSSIKPGPKSIVLVGFKNGDQTKRYALSLWEGSTSQQMIIECLDLQLGGIATSAVIKGTEYLAAEQAMNTAMIADIAATSAAVTTAIPLVIDLAVKAVFVKLSALLITWNAQLIAINAQMASFKSTQVKVK